MSSSRIAIFEGYGTYGRRRTDPPIVRKNRSGGGSPSRYGGPVFQNPRQDPRMGQASMGRRSYYVPPREESWADSKVPHRKGYKVKAKRNTPKMKKAMARFSKAAKTCSRRRKGSFQACMKKALKKKR